MHLGETLQLTLHLEGEPGSQINVAVSASSGAVSPATGAVILNSEGKATFDVVFTPSSEGEANLTFSSTSFEDVVVEVDVKPEEQPAAPVLQQEPAVEEEEDEPAIQQDEEDEQYTDEPTDDTEGQTDQTEEETDDTTG